MELFVGKITSFGPENYFLNNQGPFATLENQPAILPLANCLPRDQFVPGDLVYAHILYRNDNGARILTRLDQSLPYQIISQEVTDIASGQIKILGYACVPGEVATFVLASKNGSHSAKKAFIGTKSRIIAHVSKLARVRFNLVEYNGNRNDFLKLMIPGFDKLGGILDILEPFQASVAIMPAESIKKITKQYSFLENLYKQVTGLDLYFIEPEGYNDKVKEIGNIYKRRQEEMSKAPLKVFISYKWEDTAHNQWVKKLAQDLRNAGIEAILDKWEVRFGDSFTDYMTSKIGSADVVLFVITTNSVEAVESPKPHGGAVKFEMQMATARRTAGEDLRLIGIYREGTKTPAHLRDHRYADFRDDAHYNEELQELIDDLSGKNIIPPVQRRM